MQLFACQYVSRYTPHVRTFGLLFQQRGDVGANGPQDGRVGGRSADVVAFERLDERRLAVPRGRFGELLLALEADFRKGVARFETILERR